MKKYLLDTHVWLWFLFRDRKLPGRVRKILEEGRPQNLLLSPLSIYEAGILAATNRLTLAQPYGHWLERAFSELPVTEAPPTTSIALRASQLSLEVGDPVDRLIAATAIECEALLLTLDRRLLAQDWLLTLPE